MDSDDDTILQFKATANDQSGIRCSPKRKPFVLCKCNVISIDEQRRLLECKLCGQCYEPFDYIWKMANRQQLKLDEMDRLQKKIVEANESLQNILNYEKNAKARLKRVLASK